LVLPLESSGPFSSRGKALSDFFPSLSHHSPCACRPFLPPLVPSLERLLAFCVPPSPPPITFRRHMIPRDEEFCRPPRFLFFSNTTALLAIRPFFSFAGRSARPTFATSRALSPLCNGTLLFCFFFLPPLTGSRWVPPSPSM